MSLYVNNINTGSLIFNNNNSFKLVSPVLASNYTLTLPATSGASDNFIKLSAPGVLAYETPTFDNSIFEIVDSLNATKKAKFNMASITGGTTRTISAIDEDTTLVGLDNILEIRNKTIASSNNTINKPVLLCNFFRSNVSNAFQDMKITYDDGLTYDVYFIKVPFNFRIDYFTFSQDDNVTYTDTYALDFYKDGGLAESVTGIANNTWKSGSGTLGTDYNAGQRIGCQVKNEVANRGEEFILAVYGHSF